jgi:hypothetical protein
MEVEIVAYRRTLEKPNLGAWPLMQKLTHFRAEAHVIDGIAFVEIDFRYDGLMYCARIDAEQPSDVQWSKQVPDDSDEWEEVSAETVATIDAGTPLPMSDIDRFARQFAELHFWNDEEV